MNGLSFGALAKITSLAQPNPSWSLRPLGRCRLEDAAHGEDRVHVDPRPRSCRRSPRRRHASSSKGPPGGSRSGGGRRRSSLSGPGPLNPPTRSTPTSADHLVEGPRRRRRYPSVECAAATEAIGLTAIRRLTIGIPYRRLHLEADRREPARVMDHPLPDPVAEDVEVGRRAGVEVDPHRDGPDVELVLPDHAQRGQDVLGSMHGTLSMTRRRPNARTDDHPGGLGTRDNSRNARKSQLAFASLRTAGTSSSRSDSTADSGHRDHGDRIAHGVEHLEDGPVLAPGRVRHPVDQHGDIAGLESIFVEVATEGDLLMQLRPHDRRLLEGFKVTEWNDPSECQQSQIVTTARARSLGPTGDPSAR